jgi:hypothetical protein
LIERKRKHENLHDLTKERSDSIGIRYTNKDGKYSVYSAKDKLYKGTNETENVCQGKNTIDSLEESAHGLTGESLDIGNSGLENDADVVNDGLNDVESEVSNCQRV